MSRTPGNMGAAAYGAPRNPRMVLLGLIGIAVLVSVVYLLVLALFLRILPPIVVAILGAAGPFVGVVVGWVTNAKSLWPALRRQMRLVRDELPRRVWLSAAAWCILFLVAGMLVVADIFVNPTPVTQYNFAQAVPTNCAANPHPWRWSTTGASRCTQSGIYVKQTSRTFPELDLLDTYSQTSFQAQVQVLFTKPRDTSTYAAMIVQTPPTATPCGGYIIELKPSGEWLIQQVLPNCQYQLKLSQVITLPPGQPVTIKAVVSNGTLIASVNDHSLQLDDPVSLTPGQGVTGLMVMGIGKSVSSEVRFSNFSLQTLPTYGLVVPPGQLALVLGAVLALCAIGVAALLFTARVPVGATFSRGSAMW
jgi:hypothetical protein